MPVSTSSLLNSANARRNKIQQQEDDLVAFEYSLSSKTYDDFVAYSNYLQDRQSKAPDASSQLTYTKAIVGARKGYISNEIQRANIDLVEGNTDNRGKYGRMVDLYYQAINNGDYDLAQSLNLQLDNLSVKIQVEDQAKADSAQRVAKSMASAGVTSLKDMVSQIKDGIEGLDVNGTPVKPIKMLNDELAKGKNVNSYFAELFNTTKALQSLVGDAYNGATDQETVNKFEQDSTLRDIINGDAKFGAVIGTNGSTKNLSMDDIETAYRSQLANNPIYSISSSLDQKDGSQKFTFKENKVDDFVWTRNDDGSYSATPVRTTVTDPNQQLNTRLTNEGYVVGKDKNGKDIVNTGQTDKSGNFKPGSPDIKKGDDITIGNRLKDLGFYGTGAGGSITGNSDGTLDLITPDGNQVKASIMPDGSVRYFGAPGDYSGGQAGLYEINLLTKSTREVAPDEASDFGNASAFGGLLSQPSARGENYIKNLAGLSPVREVAPVDLRKGRITQIGARPFLQAPGGIGTANDFSGNNSPVTARLLQGANFTQGNIQKEKAAAIALQAQRDAAAYLQGAGGANINQMPVAQFASNGAPIRQLTVAKPVAQPRISVAPVIQPKLTPGVKTGGSGQLGGGFVDSNSGFRLQ
jgi:hypothetical protein